MKVESFDLEEWVSGETSADLQNILSYKLYINNILFSGNLPCIERGENQLLQLEVCDQCFVPGCNPGGYVQVLAVKDHIIWKAPLSKKTEKPSNRQYHSAEVLKHGTIFWPQALYVKFISTYGESASSIEDLQEEFSYTQAYDLWRLNASNSMRPSQNINLSFNDLGKRIVAVHSEGFDDPQCWEIYKHAIYLWKESKITSFVTIPISAKKISFYFDVKDFNQWDGIFFDEEKIYFPIGDGYGWEVKKSNKEEGDNGIQSS